MGQQPMQPEIAFGQIAGQQFIGGKFERFLSQSPAPLDSSDSAGAWLQDMQEAYGSQAAPAFGALPAFNLNGTPTGQERRANGQQGHDGAKAEHARAKNSGREQAGDKGAGGEHQPFGGGKDLRPP